MIDTHSIPSCCVLTVNSEPLLIKLGMTSKGQYVFTHSLTHTHHTFDKTITIHTKTDNSLLRNFAQPDPEGKQFRLKQQSQPKVLIFFWQACLFSYYDSSQDCDWTLFDSPLKIPHTSSPNKIWQEQPHQSCYKVENLLYKQNGPMGEGTGTFSMLSTYVLSLCLSRQFPLSWTRIQCLSTAEIKMPTEREQLRSKLWEVCVFCFPTFLHPFGS